MRDGCARAGRWAALALWVCSAAAYAGEAPATPDVGEPLIGRLTRGLIPADAPLRVAWDVRFPEKNVTRLFLPPESSDPLGPVTGDRTRRVSGLGRVNLFVITAENELGMVRRIDGHAQWWVKFDGPILFQPTVTDRSVYVLVGHYLTSLERVTGGIRWRLPLPSAPSAPVLVTESAKEGPEADNDPRIHYAGFDQALYELILLDRIAPVAKDAPTDRLPRVPAMMETKRLYPEWQTPLEHHAVPPLARVGTRLFYANEHQRVTGLNLSLVTEGRPVVSASRRFQRPLRVGPLAYGSHLFVPCVDTSLYCLDPETLDIVWRHPCGRMLTTPLQPIEDRHTARRALLVKTGDDGPVLALALEEPGADLLTQDAREIWDPVEGAVEAVGRLENLGDEPARRSIVAFRHHDGSLAGRLFLDGSEQFRTRLGTVQAWCRNTRDARIYLSMSGGIVAALEYDAVAGARHRAARPQR